MRTLDYQVRVLETLDAYLDELKEHKAKAKRVEAKLAALGDDAEDLAITIPDYAEAAWNALKAAGRLPPSRAEIPFSPRHDGCGRVVPNVTLKVPTGGGKTWLAVNAVSRIMGRYLARNVGFILWIVPNEAIYSQTLKHLKDRQHPYRQALDRAAAGRVRIMEKGDRLHAADIETHLCVMVLMLPSANRRAKETLRMFRDRGDVHGFFPPEGEQQAHEAAISRTPNLDHYSGMFPMVKDSLGNALRVIRPAIVMDEGQKAVSELAYETLYGFNPVFVLELTATPKDVKGKTDKPPRYANLLVEVTGRELDREGMIKMPLNLDARQSTDWHTTLARAVERLKTLGKSAAQLRAETGRYIRPIMLVQVERTGKDQRDGRHIHSEDVKEWLLATGFDEAEVAIKTAETNDLSQPENQDLLSPTNRVRVIITKSALQEGWDCPFAYVLCSLSVSSNQSAMTQLVGRILRQPHALKTGVEALDECYVITHHAATGAVVEAIKQGLESDGLGDLVRNVKVDDPTVAQRLARKIDRRKDFAKTEIYLPKVLRVEGDQARELDYETDLLAALDWRDYDPAPIADAIPENAQLAESQLQRIKLADDGRQLIVGERLATSSEGIDFDPTYAVRMISDLVPNPFVGREIVESLLHRLRERGFDEAKIGGLSGLITDELRKGLDAERADRAEALFKAEVEAGRIQFRLRVDGRNWRMPFTVETTQPTDAAPLTRDGRLVEKSLFDPVYRDDMNADERDVAIYLDKEETLAWWHRNVARVQYGLQGWRRGRIYPDFIFAIGGTGKGRRIVVLEMKGDHLEGNIDTDYKRRLLSFLSDRFQWDTGVPAGQLELVQQTGETVECALILMSEWEAKLPDRLTARQEA